MTTDSIVAFKDEVQLAGWSESHSGGAKVTFFLRDASALDAFRSLTVAKGKQAGHRFAMVLVEIGDDEQPVDQTSKRGSSAVTKLAAMFCGQERFWQWARLTHPAIWNRAEAIVGASGEAQSPIAIAAEFVRRMCSIRSRAELDTNMAAQKVFHEHIRVPFAKSVEDASAF